MKKVGNKVVNLNEFACTDDNNILQELKIRRVKVVQSYGVPDKRSNVVSGKTEWAFGPQSQIQILAHLPLTVTSDKLISSAFSFLIYNIEVLNLHIQGFGEDEKF